MRKIYSFMVAAAALFIAASCNKELPQEQLPVGETVVYTASVDGGDTKAVLDGTVSKWKGEEWITLLDGTNTFSFKADAGETPVSTIDFSYTPGEGDPKFEANEVLAVYPSGDYSAKIAETTVSNIVVPNNQKLVNNTYPATAAIAIAHSTDGERTLSFKNATTLLKFKVAGDDVTYGCFAAGGDISGVFDVNYNEGKPSMTATTPNQWVDFHMDGEFLSKDATYYIAIAPTAVANFTFYLNGQEIKKKSDAYTFKRNVILDLGTFTYVAPKKTETVYLKPGEWASDAPYYYAYFYNSLGNVPVLMTDADSDGIYEADVPDGDYSKVIFCRFDNSVDSFAWESVWNQTNNLDVPVATDEKVYFVITGWGEGEGAKSTGEWKTREDVEYVAPEFVAQEGYVYLQPSSEWLSDGARFAAYFFNQTWLDMTLVEGQKDIYQCAIPEGEVDIIFCRMNPSTTENNWDNKWNQTANLKMTDGNLYIVNGWEAGSWTGNPAVTEPEVEEPEVVIPGETSEWALVGAFSSWADKFFVTTETANVLVYKNVAMKAAEGFLVRKPSTDWTDKYGASNVNYLKANHYITTSKDGADMCLEADGTYDIYFNVSNKAIYIMTAGTDYTTAVEQTVSGKEPVQEEPEVTEKVVYLKPNSNWTQSNARFAAYIWGGTAGEKWVSMTAVGDGTYVAHIPEGYDYGCNIIFCRMNPSTTANNWNNKWNQTSDLKTPTDGKNLYTVKDGTWDKGGGTWSVK